MPGLFVHRQKSVEMNMLVVIVSRKSTLVILAIFGTCAVDSDMLMCYSRQISRTRGCKLSPKARHILTLIIAPLHPPKPLTLVGLR